MNHTKGQSAIAIDSWKRQIFERELSAEGYDYTIAPFTVDTLIITVKTHYPMLLKPVVDRANEMCAASRNQ